MRAGGRPVLLLCRDPGDGDDQQSGRVRQLLSRDGRRDVSVVGTVPGMAGAARLASYATFAHVAQGGCDPRLYCAGVQQLVFAATNGIPLRAPAGRLLTA